MKLSYIIHLEKLLNDKLNSLSGVLEGETTASAIFHTLIILIKIGTSAIWLVHLIPEFN